MAAAAVALLAIGAVWFFAREARLERDSRKRIQEALTRAEAAEQVARVESHARAMLLAHEAVQANNLGLVYDLLRDLLEQTRTFAIIAGDTAGPRAVPSPTSRALHYESRDDAAFVLVCRIPYRPAAFMSPGIAIGEAQPAFSHDGRCLALLGTNGVLAVWELEPWREHAPWKCLHVSSNNIAFDPPGKRIFFQNQDFGGVARDLEKGRQISIPKETKSRISGIGVSPDNRFVAMSSYDGTVILWVCARDEGQIRFREVSNGGGTVVFGARAANEEQRSLIPAMNEPTDAWLAFSPDGQRLAVGLADGNFHLWDNMQRLAVGLDGNIHLWDNKQRLAVGLADGNIHLWDNKQRLAVGLADGNIQLWDNKQRILVGVLKGHRQPAGQLGFNTADDALVSISPDELRVWRVADGN